MENISVTNRVGEVTTILKITFGLVPIIAGLDKFTNILTDWSQYLHPALADMLPFAPETFMIIVGVIEIIAGIVVLTKPAIGGLIVAIWLVLIALNLVATGEYLDIAVRDLVMAIAAFCLFKLASGFYARTAG